MTNAHVFSFTRTNGKPLALADYSGKLLLVVNTASKCGFTPQYKGLQALYEGYAEKGLEIVGVPCNQFGQQEPGDTKAIGEFCAINYGVSFTMTTKEEVKGENAHPFYGWAAKECGFLGKPRWNFHKYLIAPDGTMIDYFLPFTKPESSRILRHINTYL